MNERLKELRFERNLTQKQIAEHLGISISRPGNKPGIRPLLSALSKVEGADLSGRDS